MSQAGSELQKLYSSQGRSALCHSFQYKREGRTSQWAGAGSHQGYLFSPGRGTWVIAVDKWLLCFPIFPFPHGSFKLPSVSFYSATVRRVCVCVCVKEADKTLVVSPQGAALRPQERSLLIGQSPNLKLETATRWDIRLTPSGVGRVCPMLFVGWRVWVNVGVVGGDRGRDCWLSSINHSLLTWLIECPFWSETYESLGNKCNSKPLLQPVVQCSRF